MASDTQSPFVFGKVASGSTFTDREGERKRLSENIRSHINSILISPRRWGKSSLVAETGRHLSAESGTRRFCYLDLFNVRTEQEFYAVFAREVLRVSFGAWEERLENAKRFFKRIQPKFTVGADPSQEFSVSFDWDDVERAPDEILDLPENIASQKDIELVVCIDEFQNLSYFDHPDAFQKKLRAHWQHHGRTTYCLYGSKRHMMTEIFENASMPFFKFGDVLFLEKIPESYWIPYITGRFQSSGKSIGTEQASAIARHMENHPYFVQQLAHAAWSITPEHCSQEVLEKALGDLMIQQTIMFQRDVDDLTNHQLNFLKALIDEVPQMSAAKTLQEYHLGTSANIGRIKESLVRKDIIDVYGPRIEFLDPLFKRWFRSFFMEGKSSKALPSGGH